MRRGSRRLSPIGGNMNDAGYPFRGPYKLDGCINHGHSGAQGSSNTTTSSSPSSAARTATSLALRVTGSNLRVEQLHTTHDAALRCELAVDDGAPRPVQASLVQTSALAVPGDGHAYHLITTIVPPRRATSTHALRSSSHHNMMASAAAAAAAVQHTCRLTLHSVDGVLRIRAPPSRRQRRSQRHRHTTTRDGKYNNNDDDNNDNDDEEVQLLVDGKALRPVAGCFVVPTDARDCRLVVRAMSRPRRHDVDADDDGGVDDDGGGDDDDDAHATRRPPRASIAIEAVPSGATARAMLWCPGTGKDVELHAHEPARVPVYEGGIYRLLLPSTAPSAPQEQQQQPQSQSPPSTLMLRWCREPTQPLPVDNNNSHVVAATPCAAMSRLYAPATCSIRVDDMSRDVTAAAAVAAGGANKDTAATGFALLPSPSSAPVRGDVGVCIDGTRPQRVVVEQGGDAAAWRVVLDIDAQQQQQQQQQQQTMSPQQNAPAWVAQLAAALRAPSASEAEQRLQQLTLPHDGSDADAACIVDYVKAQLRRSAAPPPSPPPPVLSFVAQSTGLHHVQCHSSSSNSSAGARGGEAEDDVMYEVVAEGNSTRLGSSGGADGGVSIAAAAGTRTASLAVQRRRRSGGGADDNAQQLSLPPRQGTSAAAGAVVVSCRVQLPAPPPPDDRGDAWLVAHVAAALQRHGLDPRRVADELAHMDVPLAATLDTTRAAAAATAAAAPSSLLLYNNNDDDAATAAPPPVAVRSVAGQVLLPLLVQCLRNVQCTAATTTTATTTTPSPQLYFTCGNGYVDNIYTEQPDYVLRARIDGDEHDTSSAASSSVVVPQHGRVPTMPGTTLAAQAQPHVVVLTVHDAHTHEQRGEARLRIMGATPPAAAAAAAPPSADSHSRRRSSHDHTALSPPSPVTAAATETPPPYLDVTLHSVPATRQLHARLMTLRELRIVCDVDDTNNDNDGNGGGGGGRRGSRARSDVTVRMSATQPHSLAVSLYDARERCVLQQRLQLPAYTSERQTPPPPQQTVTTATRPAAAAAAALLRWALTVADDGNLVVAEGDRRCAVTVAADGDGANTPLPRSGVVALDAEVAHEVRLRKQLRYDAPVTSSTADRHDADNDDADDAAAHDGRVSEVVLRLPAWMPPRVLHTVASLCRSHAAGQLPREQLQTQVEQLRRQCTRPTLRELLAALQSVLSMPTVTSRPATPSRSRGEWTAAAAAQSQAQPRSVTTANSVSRDDSGSNSRVFFRLTGAD